MATASRTSLRSFPVLLLGILLMSWPAPPADAGGCGDGLCTFSDCHTPAVGVSSALWGELEPGTTGTYPASRDTTDFDQVGDFEVNPYWISVDVEEGWLFTVAGRRLQIWNAFTNPANPSPRFDEGFRNLNLTWDADAHAFFIFEDIDAPPGDSDVVAVAGRYGVGMAVWNTTNKDIPVRKYQDHGNGRWADQVYATEIGGRQYAFLSATQQGGVFAYDLTAAKELSGTCVEGQPTVGSPCPGVYQGKIGSRTRASALDGAGNFIAFSSGVSPKGFEIWNVSNPAAPALVMNGLANDSVYALALWQQGAGTYLAVRLLDQARIYDVSCITGGSCSLGSPLWTKSLNINTIGTMTFSRSGDTPFLYIGEEGDCQQGNQNEFLYDVSAAVAPRDISPPGTSVVNGQAVSYWGWYYRRNGVHGFNRMAPRMGKFYGNVFYRAANSILDTHVWVAPSTPEANFTWSPTEIYPGTLIDFTDLSTGSPSSWDWDFLPDGNPGSSNAQNPNDVEFPSAGEKTVRLEATNGVGPDTREITLQVLPPEPTVASVSVSPNPALVCQPVTFRAESVTGQPPLTFSWEVSETGGSVVATGGNVNPFVWDVPPGQDTGLTYEAEVTITNSSDSTSLTSTALVLQGLPVLPAAGAFTPTYEGAPEPPLSGEVQFHVDADGATEWNWNFGDNPGGGPLGDGFEGWTSDPVNGPNPLHTYATNGSYDVQVKVRNCVEAERASTVLSVEIPDTTPLEAEFRASLFCIGSVCPADLLEQITFNDLSIGDPDFWDYDWNGDGTFEDQDNALPVIFHVYSTADVYYPRLRVRRGSSQALFEDHLVINVGGVIPDPEITLDGPESGEVGQVLNFTASMDDCRLYENGWQWTTDGGGDPVSSNAIGLSWTEPGVKTVTVTNGGCSETAEKTVNITADPAFFADGFETGDTTAWDVTVP